MFTNDLYCEINLLQNIQKSHYEKLCAPNHPSGILLCQKHTNSYRWRKRDMQENRLITTSIYKSDQALAQNLAVNLYHIICIQNLQMQINSIDNLLRSRQTGNQHLELPDASAAQLPFYALFRGLRHHPLVPADFFDPHSPYRPFILSYLQEEYAWLIEWYLADYKKNPDHPEHLIFPVRLGYNVRSKSEVIIADRLYEEGILFHYEEQLLFTDHDCYPDFTIPVTCYEQYAWEHFGAMDNTYYYNRTRGKILDFLDHQRLPGINMITTYETKKHPLTIDHVNQKIRWLKRLYRLSFPDLPPDNSFNMYDLASHFQNQRSR